MSVPSRSASPPSSKCAVDVAAPPRALFVTDLDGTLLDGPRGVPTANVEALHEAADAGVALALVTGRRRTTIAAEHAVLKGLTYFTCASNGAVVLGPDHHSPVHVREIGWAGVLEAARRPSFRNASLLCITLPADPAPGQPLVPDVAVLAPLSGRWHFATHAWDRETWNPCEADDALSHPLLHLAVWVETREEAEALEPELREIFGADVDVHCVARPGSTEAMAEVVPLGGKGSAVRHLAEKLGLPLEATGGVGDDMNDGALLDAVRHRFAVGGSLLARRRTDAVEVVRVEHAAVADAVRRFLAAMGLS